MLTWWLVVAICCTVGASECPRYCSCFTDPDGYNSANCSTLALGSVQPSSLDLLSFQPHDPGYATKMAPRSFLAFRKIKFLWMVNCSVLNLPNDVFQGLDLVIKIDLSHNKIRHLNGVVFKSLGNLHTLHLRGNPLLLTPWDVIVSDTLQELDLGYSGLRTIPQGTFISVPRLMRLYLDGNRLHTFTFNMIPAGLRYLNLARNRIIEVPTDILSSMSNLRKLDLSKNPIKCNCNLLIMQDWFSGQGIIFENEVKCTEPSQYAGKYLSKINENELCTSEEAKRQRRINDIENDRDSKTPHKLDNMIDDRDYQSDQPKDELDSEVLYQDEKTLALGTHMEFNEQLYPVSSDENNKLLSSKKPDFTTAEDLVTPTKQSDSADIESIFSEESKDPLEESSRLMTNETSNFSIISQESITQSSKIHDSLSLIQNISNYNSSEEYIVFNTTTSIIETVNDTEASLNDTHTTNSPEHEMADEGYSPFYSSSPSSKIYSLPNGSLFDLELSPGVHDSTYKYTDIDIAMADEGYSLHLNTSEDTVEDEIGSGDEPLENHPVTKTSSTLNEVTSAPVTFPWQSSSHDPNDYSYDTQHDYSAEVGVTTTESMHAPELEEGSGAYENDDKATSSSLPPYTDDDDIETSTEGFITVHTSSELTSESTTDGASPSPSNPTEEESTTELAIETTTFDLVSFSEDTTHPSSSEISIVTKSSTPEPHQVVTSTEHDFQSSSTSEEPYIPLIVKEETTPGHSDTSLDDVVKVSSTETPLISNDAEVINKIDKTSDKGRMMIEPTVGGREEGRLEEAHSTLTLLIVGLIIALVCVVSLFVCRKVSKGVCASKKKVRLPKDPEANHATEMQDMLLPKPPENGVKIIPLNGNANGKEIKEEEIPVLQKDWDEKTEPIETVTARLSEIAGPQTPVFIHKTIT